MFLTVAMSVGSAASGLLMQRRVLSSAQIICISAIMLVLGLWLLFPGQSIGVLHDNVHLIAYGALFWIGFGAILGEMAAYKAMEDLQVIVFKRGMGAKNRSIASGLFYIMVCIGAGAGSSFSVVVLDYLNYDQGAWIMMGCAGISLLIGVGIEVVLRSSVK